MKNTAVEWLFENLIGLNADMKYSIITWEEYMSKRADLLEQAKEMEKEQMFDYIKKNYVNGENSLKFHTKEFEQYYKETFKSK